LYTLKAVSSNKTSLSARTRRTRSACA